MDMITSGFITKAKEVHGDKFDYSLVEYNGALTKVRIICPIHGVFEQRASHHLNGSGCKKCSASNRGERQRNSTEQFIIKAKEAHGDKYSYELTEYVNAKTKVKIICPVHGVFEQLPYSHTIGKGCKRCGDITSTQKQQYTTKQFITKAKDVHGDKYSYELVEYVNNRCVLSIICPNHGVFKQRAMNHINSRGCPKCGCNNISQQEQELQQWLSQHIDITTNDRTLIAPLELDIVVPSKKIAIEYNGIYWHSEQRGKDRNYHIDKYNLCMDKGYRLIQVWENEWLQKKDIVKSIILSAIGQYERKIGARQCAIRTIPSKEARIIYDNNHIQGFHGGEHHALYHKGEIVSLMTIDNKPELQRFVNKKNTLVHGAFTKLLKSFDNLDGMITFADLRYFTGNVYKNNGFEYQYISKPNYFYFKDDIKLWSRVKFQKHKLKRKLDIFDPNQTEYQNMLANGYDRIWDCGNLKYIYKGDL